MTTYQQYFPTFLPPWLANDAGNVWAGSFGTLADGIVDGATNAVKCSIIQTAPDDALPYLGAARPHVIRYPGESADSYRAALAQAFDFAGLLGTDWGIITMLARAGLSAQIVRNNQWNADGHPGNVDPYWARFWVVIQNPGTWSAGSRWGGGGRWGSSFRFGITGLSQELEDYIINVCLTYKASHARLMRIRCIVSGTPWGSGYTWGGSFTWGGVYADIYTGRPVT